MDKYFKLGVVICWWVLHLFVSFLFFCSLRHCWFVDVFEFIVQVISVGVCNRC